MKTVIFNGSPRIGGDTAFLIESLTKSLEGEIIIHKSYKSAINSCSDCRYCCKNIGCIINDDMQKVYSDIIDADNIIIASPVYFSELTGTLLALFSRLQMFYGASKFSKTKLITKEKQGVLILTGGGEGACDNAEKTANILFSSMNAKIIKTIYSLETDIIPTIEDKSAINDIKKLAIILNQHN